MTSVEYVFDENVAEGQVIRATDTNGNEITAGQELPEGSGVILYVSKGAEGFAMPDVIGMTEAAAKSTLEQAGLIVVISHVQNTAVTEGTVFEQSISPDANVTLGTQVEISVATTTPVTDTPAATLPNGSTPTQTPTKVPGNTSTPTPTPTPTNTPTPTPSPEYSITFDSNGGSSVSSIKLKYGDSLGDLPTSERDYYYFAGWTSGGSEVDSDTVVTSNMTLTAQWELKDEWSDWSEWDTTKLSEEKNDDGLVIVEVESVYRDTEYEYNYYYWIFVSEDGTERTPFPNWGNGNYIYNELISSKLEYVGDYEYNGYTCSMYEDSDGNWWTDYGGYDHGWIAGTIYAHYEYRSRTRIP